MARELDETYPNSRLELWDHVGHSPQIEDRDRFRSLLASFLEGAAMT
jgi:pimeloyl-ACP methyl ester carboxylesterase